MKSELRVIEYNHPIFGKIKKLVRIYFDNNGVEITREFIRVVKGFIDYWRTLFIKKETQDVDN